MALNEKYTWADFLRRNPDKKELKRTTPQGKKAFEAAFKAHIKEYLKSQLESLAANQTKATKARDELVVRLKAVKTTAARRKFQLRVGQKDHAMAAIAKQIERTKQLQKRA